MKSFTTRLRVVPRLLLPALLALLFQSSTSQAQIGLASGNSTVTINTNGAATGAVNWTIDGVNILNSTASGLQSFYYSMGGGVAQNLTAIGSPTVANISAQETKVTYANATFSIAVDYFLNGGVAGSGTSGLQESINIQNNTASSLSLRFYSFSDFTSIASAQVALGVNAMKTRFNDGEVFSPTMTVQQVDNTLSPGSQFGQLNVTLSQLLAGPGAFNPSGIATNGAIGPFAGNSYVTASDITLAANGSLVINDGNTASVAAPEPATWAMLALGLITLGSVRYFRRSTKATELAPAVARDSRRSAK